MPDPYPIIACWRNHCDQRVGWKFAGAFSRWHCPHRAKRCPCGVECYLFLLNWKGRAASVAKGVEL